MADKEKKDKKGFFAEFKEFIMRGNILDMAIGIIIGSAFTAIVTALTDHILKPIINWILAAIIGTNSLSEVYTYLKVVTDEEGVIDLTQSIYIDWGTFINAIINFLLIALVLFIILKALMRLQKMRDEAKEKLQERGEKKEAEKAEAEAQNADETAENVEATGTDTDETVEPAENAEASKKKKE